MTDLKLWTTPRLKRRTRRIAALLATAFVANAGILTLNLAGTTAASDTHKVAQK